MAALVLPLAFSLRKSITYDEVVHLSAGYSYLQTGKIVLNPMHPPLVKELAAVPLLLLGARMPATEQEIEQAVFTTYQWRFGKLFFDANDVQAILPWCRLPAIALSFGLAALVTVWSYQLWGARGALLSLFLYVTDPTITAHAQLITTDVPLACFATLFFFLFRHALRSESTIPLLASAVALGLALATKFTAIVLPPLALALWTWSRTPRTRILRAAVPFGALLALAALVVWATYLFPRDPAFYWNGLTSLESDHRAGFDYVLLGEIQEGRDLRYFPIAWLLKTPLATILLLALSVALFFRGRRTTALEEASLIAPAVAFAALVTALAPSLGVRYLIPVSPFLYVFAGRIGLVLSARKPAVAAIVGALLLWQATAFVTVAPDHLSYFNELAGGSRHGPEWLDESNVDWGQGLIQLREYLEREGVTEYVICHFGSVSPELYGVTGPRIPWRRALRPPRRTLFLSAHYAARVRAVLSLEYGDSAENWIAHAQPTAIIGHAYYRYDPPERPKRRESELGDVRMTSPSPLP